MLGFFGESVKGLESLRFHQLMWTAKPCISGAKSKVEKLGDEEILKASRSTIDDLPATVTKMF